MLCMVYSALLIRAEWLSWTLRHDLSNIFFLVSITPPSTCVRHMWSIFQKHVVPSNNVPMWWDIPNVVLTSESSLGIYYTRKCGIPYDTPSSFCGVMTIFTLLCISTEHARQRANMYQLCTWHLVIALWTIPLPLLTPTIFTYITENCTEIY